MLYVGQRIESKLDPELLVFYLGIVFGFEDILENEYSFSKNEIKDGAYLLKVGDDYTLVSNAKLLAEYDTIRGEDGEIYGLEFAYPCFLALVRRELADEKFTKDNLLAEIERKEVKSHA